MNNLKKTTLMMVVAALMLLGSMGSAFATDCSWVGAGNVDDCATFSGSGDQYHTFSHRGNGRYAVRFLNTSSYYLYSATLRPSRVDWWRNFSVDVTGVYGNNLFNTLGFKYTRSYQHGGYNTGLYTTKAVGAYSNAIVVIYDVVGLSNYTSITVGNACSYPGWC